jgi:lipid-A-disaccharide synthase
MAEALESSQQLIFIVAAEPSGDALGGPVIEALNRLYPGRFRFMGVGGEQMQAAGLETLFPMEDLTAFGLAEVLPKIPLILKRLKQVQKSVRVTKPSLLLTIDAPDFSFRLAKKLKNFSVRKVHMVAPTVWAWRPKRAAKVARLYDHLLCLFPFEPPYFEREGLAASFIGHPLVSGPVMTADGAGFRQRIGAGADERLLMVLPGSRTSEIERLLPVFGETMRLLHERIGGFRVVIPSVTHLADTIREASRNWAVPVTVIQGASDKYAAMKACDAAIAASGTVSLELALAGLPTVIAYRVNKLSAAIFRRLTLTRWVALPNIILQRELIKEKLQEECDASKLADEIQALLDNEDARARVMEGYKSVADSLGAGRLVPADQAARLIADLVQ